MAVLLFFTCQAGAVQSGRSATLMVTAQCPRGNRVTERDVTHPESRQQHRVGQGGRWAPGIAVCRDAEAQAGWAWCWPAPLP